MATVKRNYDNDYPSVTTVLGVLRKIGLELWFKHHNAKWCDEQSNKGKTTGTQVHLAIENYILKNSEAVETEWPEEVNNALKGFMAFRRDRPDLELQWAELKLTSETYKFNGTLDCIAKKGDKLILLDWKTAEAKKEAVPKIYPEYFYQCSAYVYAYNEVMKANIEDAIIVSMAKDKIGYAIVEINKEQIDSHFHNAFLPALSIYNHQRKEK